MTLIDYQLVFCGGGSGGHVVPAITVINAVKKKYPDIKINYIGSHNGIEASLIPREGIDYSPISSGKLRRYFSWKNFTDIFKIIWGIFQCLTIMSRTGKNTMVISFGGFVSVPPVLAARIFGKKIFIHEQTTQVGLANKINSYLADRIMVSFEGSKRNFPAEKVVHTGYPVRESCLNQEVLRENLDEFIPPVRCHNKILLVTGGGNGSKLINQLIYKNLENLKKDYFIIHQVGQDYVETYKPFEDDCYKVFGFIGSEIIDLFKVADIIISRAGAGTVSELLALGKRSLFVPLKIAQKNEQFHNAMVAKEKLGSLIILEDDLNIETLGNGIHQLQGEYKDCIDQAIDGTANIIQELEKVI
jgi:UDP-N-acetylglucosamine--N-acetylmuramyl-(pentapeptide) pyrophosphoryl-undecaprenol N-acetylglucosamine transferase